jgi:leucyl-tRNA synthetase
MNSDEYNGLTIAAAEERMTLKFGKKQTTYKLRDWSISRQRYWGCPIPIVYDPEGKPHAIQDEHLPWLLPEDVDFTPTGVAPLAKSEVLKKRTVAIFGEGWTPEVETMDTFVDSSWYFLRYTDPKNTTAFASKEKQEAWMPIDVYFGGAEHTTMHVLYSRFIQKVLYDLGLATVSEPYKVRINRGLVLGPDGNKMSKSKGNVIDPDEQVMRLGADTVKMYLAFMGPYSEVVNYPWDMGGIAGIRRFLERINGLKDHIVDSEPSEITRQLHYTIHKVTRDIESFKFNTAISALMIFLNAAEKGGFSETSYKIFLRLLAPFAPHLTDELWEVSGEQTSIHTAAWPVADQSLLVKETATIAIQINGKVRATITIGVDADEETAKEIAMREKPIAERLQGATVVRVVYVPAKVLNFITI